MITEHNAGTEVTLVQMALKVISDRVKQLPQADQADFRELWAILANSADDEEFSEAQRAIVEILEHRKSTVSRMNTPADAPAESLRKWKQYIAAKIREYRKLAKMTQAELAKRVELPQSYISRLENGDHSPSHKTIQKIAAALRLEVSCFDPSC